MNTKQLIEELRSVYDKATEAANANEDILRDSYAKSTFKIGYMRSAISLIASELEKLESEK